MKRLAVLIVITCLALPAMAGAQDHERHDGGRGGPREHAADRRGGERSGDHDEHGGPGPGNGDPGPRGGDYRPRGYGAAYPRSYRFVRGQMLPPDYRDYVVGDYERHHLRRPPRGYYWYRVGDDFVLAALGSGLIFEVIAAEGY